MGRFLIKTRLKVFQAQNSAQLARLAKIGVIAKDALIKELPDGRWVRAEEHPDIGRLFIQTDNERTVVASASPYFVRGDATPPAASPEESKVFWVRTDATVVEVRGLEVLQRLQGLGVVRAAHEVSETREGPFVPLNQHPEFAGLFEELVISSTDKLHAIPRSLAQQAAALFDDEEVDESAPTLAGAVFDDEAPESAPVHAAAVFNCEEADENAPTTSVPELDGVITLAGYQAPQPAKEAQSSQRKETSQRKEISVVFALSEEELEYFQDDRSSHREVSNVILLSATDLEVFSEEEDERFEVCIEVDKSNLSADEVIALSPDDIEEFEVIKAVKSLPALDAPWEQFRKTMNSVAIQLSVDTVRQELTWDLFRSMMAKKVPVKRADGPSEASWRRFKAKWRNPKDKSVTPITAATTWDRFRQLIATSRRSGETTWDRFVRSIEAKRSSEAGRRRAVLGDDDAPQAIKGEAQINTGVIHVRGESTGPKVRIEGMGEE